MNDHSKLVAMRIVNLACIGPEGLEVSLDDILCLVGPNNTGKSTVLRAYEAAVGNASLGEDEICDRADGQPTTVEIWVHIPKGTANIDEKWKEAEEDLLLIRSKWEWQGAGKPVRTTWDPVADEYAEHGRAAGLDEVFSSRLPRPFRIHALQDPEQEHKELLELVLAPIASELKTLMTTDGSDLGNALQAFNVAADDSVSAYAARLEGIKEKVNKSYTRVFTGSTIDLQVKMAAVEVDPGKLLTQGSSFTVRDMGSETKWQQQGTGSQRALFWSMLEVRSELKRLHDTKEASGKLKDKISKELAKATKARDAAKQEATKQKHQGTVHELTAELAKLNEPGAGESPSEGVVLPGHMLLIDEPEVALHPSAIRAAQTHLYNLAQDAGWQVMLTTHCPAFINPLADHTTIIRLTREEHYPSPKTFRSQDVFFSPDDRENLKLLLLFDISLAEMFFGAYPLIVEGDTEFASFQKVVSRLEAEYPLERRPIVVRARGKEVIPSIIRILTKFEVDFSVLHDTDSPRTHNGEKASSAWTANTRIFDEIQSARSGGLTVIHRVSVPEFESHHGLQLEGKDKPYRAWEAVDDDLVLANIRATFDQLLSGPNQEAFGEGTDFAEGLRKAVEGWATDNAPDEPRFKFSDE